MEGKDRDHMYPKIMAAHFVGVGAVVIHDEKVLLVKLNYGRARGRWLIPGGMVDPGETLREAVVREVKEETGLTISPRGIIGIRSMVRDEDGLTDVYVVFRSDLVSSPTPLRPQESEIEEVAWIPLSEIKQAEVSNYTKLVVKKALEGKEMKHDEKTSYNAINIKGIKKYDQYWVT